MIEQGCVCDSCIYKDGCADAGHMCSYYYDTNDNMPNLHQQMIYDSIIRDNYTYYTNET